MSTPTLWGKSSRHSACGSYLDVLPSPNQSLHSSAPSAAPGLIGGCSEVNFSLREGSVNYEPPSSGLTRTRPRWGILVVSGSSLGDGNGFRSRLLWQE